MITEINLQNFRSYINESFEFSTGVNIIVGPNASGKTSLLESILMIATGSSYRTRDNEIIHFGKPWLRIEAHTQDFTRVVKIEHIDEERVLKTFSINTKDFKRLGLAQTIPYVLFEPSHLLMLAGSPELRRNYMDEILEQTSLGFKALSARYKRALAQRNTLLKQSPDPAKIFVWNVRLSELGGQIFNKRWQLVKQLQELVPDLYNSLSNSQEKIEIVYYSECRVDDYESNLLKKLEQNINLDILRGHTTYGPHRDDIKIVFNNKLAGEVASRGESRTIMLALKMVEAKIIETFRNSKPILLFDDVFSELDGARRQALTNFLQIYQTFITTTDADVVIQHFTQSCNIIPITNKN